MNGEAISEILGEMTGETVVNAKGIPEKIKRAKASDAHNKANGTYKAYNEYKSKLDAAKREADQLETEINSKETY